MIILITSLFEVYSLNIKCYVNSSWLWLGSWFSLWLSWFHLLEFFLARSANSAVVKMVPLAATVPTFACFGSWKIEKMYLILIAFSEAA